MSDFLLETGRQTLMLELQEASRLPERLGEDFVRAAFESVDLDWREHVESDASLGRPADLQWSGGVPDKAEQVLGWKAARHMPDVARLMVEADRIGAEQGR